MTERSRAPRSSRHASHVGVPQPAVDAHLRPLDPIGVVVHLRQRASLRACVALRQRVLAVAAHTGHHVAVDVYEDSAHRGADAAEASDRAHAFVGMALSSRPRDNGDRVRPHANVVNDNNAVNDNILDIVSDMADRRYHHGDLRAALLDTGRSDPAGVGCRRLVVARARPRGRGKSRCSTSPLRGQGRAVGSPCRRGISPAGPHAGRGSRARRSRVRGGAERRRASPMSGSPPTTRRWST